MLRLYSSAVQLPPEQPAPDPYLRPVTAVATEAGGVAVIVASTVRLAPLEATEFLGVVWLAVSVTVTARLPVVPVAADTVPLFEQVVVLLPDVGEQVTNPVGKLFV